MSSKARQDLPLPLSLSDQRNDKRVGLNPRSIEQWRSCASLSENPKDAWGAVSQDREFIEAMQIGKR